MDFTQRKVYAQVITSGTTESPQFDGPMNKVIPEVVNYLRKLQWRKDANDNKSINIVITESRQDNKERIRIDTMASELADGLIQVSEPIVPMRNELPQEFMQRLIANGTPESTAKFLTCDWYPDFNDESVKETIAWINDPKAARFRALNSSLAIYDSSVPDEYKTLLAYCLHYFKPFVDNMTLRS